MGRLVTLIVLLVVAATCWAQQEVLNGTFDSVHTVTAGTKATAFLFKIDDEDCFRIDFVNADQDFTFKVGNLENNNPGSTYPSPRDVGLQFFSLEISNNSALNTGIVMRWIYPSVTVDPLSMEFLVARGARWWEFDQYSLLDAQTNILTQTLPNTELMSGVNYIGIFGGNSVVVEDEGDPRYDSFRQSYNVTENVTNKFEFKLDRKQILELTVIEPNIAFKFTVNRTTSNPGPSFSPDTKGLYFFLITVESEEMLGSEGLIYNAVLNFKYPAGVPGNIEEDNLHFLIFDGTHWKSFLQGSQRSSQFLTQPTNSLTDFSSLQIIIAVVAKEVNKPVESTKPNQPSIPEESEATETSKQPGSGEDSAVAISMIPSLSTSTQNSIAQPTATGQPVKSSSPTEAQESEDTESGAGRKKPSSNWLFAIAAVILVLVL